MASEASKRLNFGGYVFPLSFSTVAETSSFSLSPVDFHFSYFAHAPFIRFAGSFNDNMSAVLELTPVLTVSSK